MRNLWLTILILVVVTLSLISHMINITESRDEVFTTIYITEDGSIKTDPPGKTVNLRRTGDLYYLYGDVYGRIVIEKNNVVIDGRGYKLYGFSSGGEETAIQIMDRYNITVMNLKIEFFHESIYVKNSTSVRILNNLINDVDYGVTIHDSINITFNNNIVSNTFMYGISMLNTKFSEISFNVFMNNYQGIIARNSSNLLIIYNLIYGESTYCGFNLYLTRYSTIAHNLVEGRYGIILLLSDNNSIYNNIFNNSEINYFVRSGINNWNINPTQGLNIVGGGIIGGNAYLLTRGSGFSQICGDEDRDGLCDQPLELDNSKWNVDYYPLRYYIANRTLSPVFYTYTEILTKTITLTLTETRFVTAPSTITITHTEINEPKTITLTKTEITVNPTTIIATTTATFITTQNTLITTSTKIQTETSIVTRIYTTTPIEQVVSSIISTLIALILAVAAIAILSILSPEKKR